MAAPLHPLIQGLLDCLPAPGAVWPRAGRDAWLVCAEAVFALLYKNDEEGAEVAQENRQERGRPK